MLFKFMITTFLALLLLSYCLADSELKKFFTETGDKIEEAYGKAKKTAKDAVASARDTFNKGIDKINENIQPKDTFEQIKKIIPGSS